MTPNIQFDVHDAWSRFHHLENVYLQGIAGLAPSNIDTREWEEIASEGTQDAEEIERLTDSWLRSQITERSIAKMFLAQTVVASLVAALEYSLIEVFSAYEIENKGSANFRPAPGVNPFSGKFLTELSKHGVGIDTFEHHKPIMLGVQIRNAVMHRGGIVDVSDESVDQPGSDLLVGALREGWPIQRRRWGVSDRLFQIDFADGYVSHLTAICKDIVDEFHRRLAAKTREYQSSERNPNCNRNGDAGVAH